MTDAELEERLRSCVAQERKIHTEIISLIREADHRRVFLNGFSSLFDWLTQSFGYSESAAYRRIQAARLVEAVPELARKLEAGITNLTVLAQAQTAIKREEKRTGERLSAERKRELTHALEAKTSQQAQQILANFFPSAPPRESVRAIGNGEHQLTAVIVDETVQVLSHVRELLSHAKPEAGWSDAVQHVVKKFGEKLAAQFASAAAKPRGKETTRKMLLERAGHQCEFVDHKSGRRCQSRYQLEREHIRPRALGGGDEIENARILCRQHNLLMAERNLGRKKMEPFRKWPSKSARDQGPDSSATDSPPSL